MRGSFAKHFSKPEVEIVDALKTLGELPGSYNAHKLFLNLRQGDWVAVKKEGAPRGHKPNLIIQGFARVTHRRGKVYFYRAQQKAHCVHATFLEHEKQYRF